RRLGKDIGLKIELEPGLPLLISDAAQLEQVILNLAVNAREAMPGGGEVRVVTGRTTLDEPLLVEGGDLLHPGSYVRMSVGDTGPGVPGAVRERIFEPFFTTKGGRGVGAGFGLS